jgi:hypothetical protein
VATFIINVIARSSDDEAIFQGLDFLKKIATLRWASLAMTENEKALIKDILIEERSVAYGRS